MLRTVTRLPLRRCVHTNAGSSSTRVFKNYSTRSRLTLGATVTLAAYMTWSLSSDSQRISLDAKPLPASKKLPASATPSLPAADSPPPSIQTEETSSVPVLEEDADKTPPVAPVETSSEEQPSGGAYNPVTGEINWDCPCLGGMAHGPCGPEFREAFSCFVYSEKEPKGIDCVEKFKAMQNCFREHPDVYGEEIMDDDDEEDSQGQATPSDVNISEAEYATLDNVAPDTASAQPQPQHPPPPISTP